MTKLLSKAAVVALSAIVASPCLSARTIWDGLADTEWEGDGSPGNPYLISSAAELAGLAKRTNANETFEGKYFRLTTDLWLSDTATPDKDKPLWDPIGMSNINNDAPEQNPGGFWSEDFWFKGNFDGDGHTIHNLWYAHDSEFVDNFDDPFNDGTFDFTGWSKSLFGNIENATITNPKLENANIQSVLQGAALVCVAKNSTITDIAVDGLIMCGRRHRGRSRRDHIRALLLGGLGALGIGRRRSGGTTDFVHSQGLRLYRQGGFDERSRRPCRFCVERQRDYRQPPPWKSATPLLRLTSKARVSAA